MFSPLRSCFPYSARNRASIVIDVPPCVTVDYTCHATSALGQHCTGTRNRIDEHLHIYAPTSSVRSSCKRGHQDDTLNKITTNGATASHNTVKRYAPPSVPPPPTPPALRRQSASKSPTAVLASDQPPTVSQLSTAACKTAAEIEYAVPLVRWQFDGNGTNGSSGDGGDGDGSATGPAAPAIACHPQQRVWCVPMKTFASGATAVDDAAAMATAAYQNGPSILHAYENVNGSSTTANTATTTMNTTPQVPVYLSSSMSSDSTAAATAEASKLRRQVDSTTADAENVAHIAIMHQEATIARLRDTIAALVRRYV